MKVQTLILGIVVLVSDAAFSGETATRWNGTSEILFSGTSTLHNWSGKVAAEPFVATVLMDGGNRPLSLTAKVKVEAVKMDTGEAKRDENMHQDMKVATYPLIIGTMDTAFDKVMPDGRTPSNLPFALSIMGGAHRVNGRVSNWSIKGDVATFDLDFELSLKKCGIKVPAVLLVISVGDTIRIHAPVRLVRAAN